MSERLREYFDAVVTHEAHLWGAVDARLASAGAVRAGRLVYLRAIGSIPGARVQDVADRLGITVGAASRFTDRMVGDDLVVRVPHPTDRRSSRLELTPAGERALRDADAAFDAALRALLGDEDADDLARVTEALRRVTAEVARRSRVVDA